MLRLQGLASTVHPFTEDLLMLQRGSAELVGV